MRDLLMAAKPGSSLLRRIECAGCGKVVWVDRQTKYCFDCEREASDQATPPKSK